MGCVASKRLLASSPPFECASSSAATASRNVDGSSAVLTGSFWNHSDAGRTESGESKVSSATNATGSVQNYRLGNLYNYIEGEQVAAGWPTWLTAVAREAVYGWVPLRAESYQKLEKIGQGTYSNVFKARDLDTGKIVALKKVRFNNYEPEGVRFMAREILILRRLNHPNIVKLEGLITSRLSCSIYLVFEYMEHDLAGMTSSPDIRFSESQVKCYMHQLLSGLEHCHSHGIMHRDIKCANLLVNNEGILKIADFGLANFYNAAQRQPLTSRVVTLWYRPPELLLGSTDYEATVDLWSVGCVFAEIFLGRPVLQGRTEVEQIHKIFKLCGSPPEDYWRNAKLPHAVLFKPQHPYEKCLKERFRCLPECTFRLLETLLSVEPNKRGTCRSALSSEYFKTKPFACDPSSLPKYSASKELDAKSREESCRRVVTGRENGTEATRRTSRTQTMQQINTQSKLDARPEEKWKKTYSCTENGPNQGVCEKDRERRLFADLQPVATINSVNEAQQPRQMSERGHTFSQPFPVSDFSGLVWARKQQQDYSSSKTVIKSNLRGKGVLQPKVTTTHADVGANGDSKECKPYDIEKQIMLKKWIQGEDYYDSLMPPIAQHHQKIYGTETSKQSHRVYQQEAHRIDLSGPLLSQPDKVEELLEKHERHIRQAVRKSWFQRGKRNII